MGREEIKLHFDFSFPKALDLKYMSSVTKILLGVFALITVVLGAEAYVFFKPQLFPQTKRAPAPTLSSQIRQGTQASLIEIKGLALVGFLNLFDITKAQIKTWADTSGAVSVPTYSGPIPTLPPNLPATISAQISSAPRPDSVQIVAGYFKSQRGNTIILRQQGGDVNLSFRPGARLWIKTGNKVQLVSTSLGELLASGKISTYMSVNDLFLAPNVTEVANQFTASALVIFH